MDYTFLIHGYMEKTRNIKEANYKKYHYVEPLYAKVETTVNYEETEFKSSKDFKSFHMDIKKQAKYDKTKPGSAKRMEYEEDEDCVKVNILKDPVFEMGGATGTDSTTSSSSVKDLNDMSVRELMKDIRFYIKKKAILLTQSEMEEIEKMLNDPLFERKKFLKYSKSSGILSKIEFLKKIGDDCYELDFEEKKESEGKKYVRKSFFK